MMKSLAVLLTGLMLACPALSGAPLKLEDWVDTQGAKFKAEPVEVLGPIGLFRTGRTTGRRIPFRFLKEEDCVRFRQGLERHEPRAADWAEAKAELSAELKGRTQQVKDGKLVDADFKGRAEPLLYVVFFVANGEGGSWDMLGTANGPYWELQKKHPGMVEGVMYGLRHSLNEHANMAKTMNLPWLVTDLYAQSNIESLRRYAPGEGYAMVVLSRQAVPLFSIANPDKETVTQTLGEVLTLLDLLRPENPKSWPDRAYYEGALRKAEFAKGKADPFLIGNPLLPEGLRQRKVYHLEATLDVAADGLVTHAVLSPETPVPEKLAPALVSALKKAVLVPAIENGSYVPGTYKYQFHSEP